MLFKKKPVQISGQPYQAFRESKTKLNVKPPPTVPRAAVSPSPLLEMFREIAAAEAAAKSS